MNCGVADVAQILRGVAVVEASSCSSDWTPAWESPYSANAALKSKTNKQTNKLHSHLLFDLLVVPNLRIAYVPAVKASETWTPSK